MRCNFRVVHRQCPLGNDLPVLFNLTIVIAARNDKYGGLPAIDRLQNSLDILGRQLELIPWFKVEVILVEWNPDLMEPSVADALVRKPSSIASLRIIAVPPQFHRAYDANFPGKRGPDVLEFSAKNVGIRRARSLWILPMAMDTFITTSWWKHIAQEGFGDPDDKVVFRMPRIDLRVPLSPNQTNSDLELMESELLNNVKTVWGASSAATPFASKGFKKKKKE